MVIVLCGGGSGLVDVSLKLVISPDTTTPPKKHSAAAGVKQGPLGQFLQQGWTEPSTRYMLAPPISPDDIPGRVLEAIQRCVGV